MSKISRLVGGLCLLLMVSLGLVAPGQALPGGSTPVGGSIAAQAAEPKPTKPGKPGKPDDWEAHSGPFFNDPHLTKGHFQIERRVINTIKHTPKGSTIRIAIYSLDRIRWPQALVAAHRRGVQVQMLLNDHWENRAMKVLRAEIGKNPRKGSFIYKCKQSCRGAANEFNNLHSKFYLFSQAGMSEDVVAVGSANMTRNAASTSGTTSTSPPATTSCSASSSALFNDMRNDYDTRQQPFGFCGTPPDRRATTPSTSTPPWPSPVSRGPRTTSCSTCSTASSA